MNSTAEKSVVRSMVDSKKFYWLKLKRDFFKRHDIRIIEEMENGKDYILFYLKLLLESITHEGRLRFSETIPYNEKMLSVITNTNIDIVRAAMKVFAELHMVEILDDNTIYMSEVLKLTGSETPIAERVRKSRNKKKALSECNNVTHDCYIETKCNTEIEKEKEIEKEIDIESISDKPKRAPKKKYGEYGWVKLTDEQYHRLCAEFGEDTIQERIRYIDEYVQGNGNKNKYSDWNLVIRRAIRDNWGGKRDAQIAQEERDPFLAYMEEQSRKEVF